MTMLAADEVLVPRTELPTVKEAVGTMRSVRFNWQPSTRRAARTSRVVVAPAEALASAERRQALDDLLRAVSTSDPAAVVIVVFLGVIIGLAAIEAYGRYSRGAKRVPWVAPDIAALRRLLLARRHGAEKSLIARASLEDGALVVWSCEPKRYEVPVGQIPALAALSDAARRGFEVSESGSRIHWPEGDVDLNLDTVRELVDPDVKKVHAEEARRDAARYAAAIRGLREAHGLKQAEMAGLTEREVRRIEHGETVPRIESLRKLATAHGLTVPEYLGELAKRSRRRHA